jgi:hypothetical protein
MNDESMIRYLTGAVVGALEPKFDSLHCRITEQARETAELKGVVSQMPTKDDMHQIVDSRMDRLAKRRQWVIAILLSLPAAAMSAIALIKIFTY